MRAGIPPFQTNPQTDLPHQPRAAASAAPPADSSCCCRPRWRLYRVRVGVLWVRPRAGAPETRSNACSAPPTSRIPNRQGPTKQRTPKARRLLLLLLLARGRGRDERLDRRHKGEEEQERPRCCLPHHGGGVVVVRVRVSCSLQRACPCAVSVLARSCRRAAMSKTRHLWGKSGGLNRCRVRNEAGVRGW